VSLAAAVDVVVGELDELLQAAAATPRTAKSNAAMVVEKPLLAEVGDVTSASPPP
jgi:hypothetical protein